VNKVTGGCQLQSSKAKWRGKTRAIFW